MYNIIMNNILHKKDLPIKIAMILMALFGIIISFMVPTWQTPDEIAHLQMISDSVENPKIAGYLVEDLDMDRGRITFVAEEKLDIQKVKEAMVKKPSYHAEDAASKGINLSLIKHLPATIGLLLGIALKLPTYWVMQLAELAALAFYMAVCWLAIKIMPLKKEVLLIIMAFPMTMQQAASLSYDAVLLPLCYLFIAYVFYIAYTLPKVGIKEVVLTVLLFGIITYLKLPYVFIIFLVFMIPLEKISLEFGRWKIDEKVIRKWRIPVGVLLVALCVVAVYLLRDHKLVSLVLGMVVNLRTSLGILLMSFLQWKTTWMMSSVGQFGWLDSWVSIHFVRFSYFLVILLSVLNEGYVQGSRTSSPDVRINGKARGVLWGVSIIMILFTIISLIDFTIKFKLFGADVEKPYDVKKALELITYVEGVQGRYFLPHLPIWFLPLPAISIPFIKNRGILWKSWVVVGYILLAAGCTISVLYTRYWVG